MADQKNDREVTNEVIASAVVDATRNHGNSVRIAEGLQVTRAQRDMVRRRIGSVDPGKHREA